MSRPRRRRLWGADTPPLVERLRPGAYRVNLSPEERDVLRDLPRQLQELLGQTEDPSLRRLFPPAYVDDREREAEYRQLMGDDLLQGRQASLAAMAASIDLTELDEAQITAWLSSLNDLRLVIGTQLDIQEDDEVVDSPIHHLYYYLTMLEDAVIEALSSQFD